jgi:signal transduction histidine kinase/ActR/RegA family two-component response regulator
MIWNTAACCGGTQHDITELKNAEHNLSSTLSLLDAALESTEDGILVISSTGKITKMNQKFIELWQIPPELAISSDDDKLLHYVVKQLADPEAFLTRVKALYDAPADASFDEIKFSDGRVFERYSQPQWLDKQIVGRVWSFRDVTYRKRSELEQKKLQAQLLQAHKMESVGRLAGGVAHDFNNMLGVILGHTELALLRTDDKHKLCSDLNEIQKAAKRSADITKQLLAFARKQTISPRQLDLNDTVESMLNMLRRLIGENIDLAWNPAPHIWSVKIDPSQIDQILANLCVNARDAISGVGKLTIETGRKSFDEAYCNEHPGVIPGDFALLAVSDNGCGMDKEILDNLFEPFFTTKEVGKGTGLGLATIYGIVKQNNGFINVYSEPGQGSTFKIYLPRLVAEEDTDKAVPEKKAAAGGTETILLVEDEPTILRMTRMMLERKGYTVLSAATPSAAMEKATHHSGPIDMLMTDVVMPEMNGRDLAGQITDLYPDIRLLFMSGYTSNVIAHQGVLDDGVAFIQKPFSMADMTEKVREVLDKSC